MSNQRYEIVGLTYEQARDFVDREWSGFISNGHAFQNGELFVRRWDASAPTAHRARVALWKRQLIYPASHSTQADQPRHATMWALTNYGVVHSVHHRRAGAKAACVTHTDEPWEKAKTYMEIRKVRIVEIPTVRR